MKFKSSVLITVLASFLLFSGCSKDVEEYNKPAAYWYSKVISSIASGDIEKADNYYSSLQGEHIGSPLLPEATLILAIAHMHYEEYLLSEHFADEYMKRYANINEKEFVEFLKIKAKYMALPNPRRDQVLIQEAIKESKIFKKNYPRSMYFPIVDTMLTNLTMAEAALNKSIADLYIRLDKPKSATYYENKMAQNWMNFDEIDRANSPWYREWFEGDGTESWYAFMIPDTQSVVSRNTAREEEILEEENEPVIEVEPVAEEVVEQSVIQEAKPMSSEEESEVQKAQELLDNGALTEEEFEATKERIIEQEVVEESEVHTDRNSLENIRKRVEQKEENEKPWYKPWFGTDDKVQESSEDLESLENLDGEAEDAEAAESWYDFLSW